MTLSELNDYIDLKLKEITPRLSTKSRWLWGYYDALNDLKELIERTQKK